MMVVGTMMVKLLHATHHYYDHHHHHHHGKAVSLCEAIDPFKRDALIS
jgi:hypothetical protein